MHPVTLDWWLLSTLVKLSTAHSCRGNWIGEAPYQHGRPCSQCPPSYGGGCRNNLCYKGEQTHMVFIVAFCCRINIWPTWTLSACPSKDSQRSETEDMNEVEKPQVPLPPRTTAKPAPKPKPSAPKKPVSKFIYCFFKQKLPTSALTSLSFIFIAVAVIDMNVFKIFWGGFLCLYLQNSWRVW